MTELKMEHILMLAILAFVLYHFMGRCSCANGVVNGFNVGGLMDQTYPLFPLDEKKISRSQRGRCGDSYENYKPIINEDYDFLECGKDEVCLCRSDNSVIKNTASDLNLCMPLSGEGLNTSECYKKKDIKIAKKYLTDISKSLYNIKI